MPGSTLVVGYDGTDGARAALGEAAKLHLCERPLLVVHQDA